MYGLLGSDNICPRYKYLLIWDLRVQKNQNLEKIAFKVVQMKFLATHITNQKLSLDIFMEHDLYLIFIRFIAGYCYKYSIRQVLLSRVTYLLQIQQFT